MFLMLFPHRFVFVFIGLWLGCSGAAVWAQNTAIVGKNDWLFVRHEIQQPEMAKDAQAALGLIEKFNRILARQQIELVVVVVKPGRRHRPRATG
jgi:hypothetical protein